MRNLLPKEQKNRVNKEYNFRVLVVSVWFLFAMSCIGILLTLPSFFVIQTQASALQERESLIERTIVIRKQDVSIEEIKKTRKLIERLNLEERNVRELRDIIKDIKEKSSDDIKITSLSYSYSLGRENGSPNYRISINGIASDRKILTMFSDDLEDIEGIYSSKLPVSQLAKGENIPFTIELEIIF